MGCIEGASPPTPPSLFSSLPLSLNPSSLVFPRLQMRLFAWLRRSEAARAMEEEDDEDEAGKEEKGREEREKSQLGGDDCDCEADRTPAASPPPTQKNTPCQGDTTTSKMAAAGGVLCGTNPETRCSHSTVGDTQTHFTTSAASPLRRSERNPRGSVKD